MIFANENGRTIPKEDIIFGISNRAKEMANKVGKDKVVNATIGKLLDDDGNLLILSSVAKALKELKPEDFCDYAPIGGTKEYKEAIKHVCFGSYEPKGFVEAIATPGGTGAIRNAISNYSEYGDRVLTHDWFWAPYKTIAQEIGREIETFEFLTKDGYFNADGLVKSTNDILKDQNSLVILLNTPAHNPTGYSLTVTDFRKIRDAFKKIAQDKKIALFIDAAYIDFAGDEEQYRQFIPVLDEMPENVLPIIGFSLSKTFTLYGMRAGAMICMAKTPAIQEEFKKVCEYSSRGSWSNSTRAPQELIAKIYDSPELKKAIDKERKEIRDMLIRRGTAFSKEADKIGLKMVPYDAGFFASIPCDNPNEIASELEKEGIFLVPLAKGIRVSIASISEEEAKLLPGKIKAVMERM